MGHLKCSWNNRYSCTRDIALWRNFLPFHIVSLWQENGPQTGKTLFFRSVVGYLKWFFLKSAQKPFCFPSSLLQLLRSDLMFTDVFWHFATRWQQSCKEDHQHRQLCIYLKASWTVMLIEVPDFLCYCQLVTDWDINVLLYFASSYSLTAVGKSQVVDLAVLSSRAV